MKTVTNGRAVARRAWVWGCLAAVLSAAAPGCGGPAGPLAPADMDGVKLRDVGELYRIHQVNRKAPPKALKSFNAFGNATPVAFEAIRSGEVVVRWGATLPDTAEEPTTHGSDEVLAYIKGVPGQGGPVLMLDRSVRSMTADEFKAAKLAGAGEPAAR